MQDLNFTAIMPLEVLTMIFSFLPRRDRFICMCMCRRWKDAMDVPNLWHHMSVRLDVDFFEISTIQLTIEYCKFIKSLELRFEYPEEPMQWLNYKAMDITKRAYRFLSIFVNKNLQINKLSFSNFGDFYRFKKILYYLSMFLRSQYKIKVLSFNGSYFSKKALIKILTSSIDANQSSIESVDIQNSYIENDYHISETQSNILRNQLVTCLANIRNLQVLKLDFETLVKDGVLQGFLDGPCESLKYINLRLESNDLNKMDFKHYQNSHWIAMKKKFKELKVSFIFYNIINTVDIYDIVLTRSLPIYCITWINDNNNSEIYHYCINKYSTSIEIVRIDCRYDCVDQLIVKALQTCPELQWFEISGPICDVQNVQDVFIENDFSGFLNYEIYVRVANERDLYLSKVKVFRKDYLDHDIVPKYEIN